MGNDNRFATVEECVNTCGGLSEPVVAPLVNSNCDNVIVQCDHTEAIVSIPGVPTEYLNNTICLG